jgi:hypothetical protein
MTLHVAALAADHLLLVRRVGYRESYRRVELHDVQAVAVSPTPRRRRRAVAAASGAGVLAVFAVAAGGGFRVFWTVVALCLLGVLAAVLAAGPSCRVRLRTPIDWVEMPSLRRLRTAERALERLAERVTAEQGELPEEEARARLAEVAPLLDAATARDGASAAEAPRGPATRRWHRALAALLAGEVAISTAQASASPPGWLDAAATVFFLVELAVALAAVVTQSRGALPRGLRRWATTALVVLSASAVFGFYATTFGAIFSGEPPPAGVGLQLTPPETLRLSLALWGLVSALALCVGWLVVRRARTPPATGTP